MIEHRLFGTRDCDMTFVTVPLFLVASKLFLYWQNEVWHIFQA